jgi:two-component system sensor histidine kinase EvgS
MKIFALLKNIFLSVFMLCIFLWPFISIADERIPEFTKSELQWIKKNPLIKFSIHEKYRDYWTSGIYPSLLAKLKDYSGLDFQPIWRTSNIDVHDQLKNKQIQFIIDPDLSSKEIDIGFISDPIFWGQDVVIKPITTNESPHLHAQKIIYFDRGYNLVNSKPDAVKISSSKLLVEKLVKGEADLAIMPLRLASALSQELYLYRLEIKPWGNHPFAYRWLIAKHNKILNSIIQKSLQTIDPMVLGSLTSTTRFGPLESKRGLMEKNISSFIGGLCLGLVLLLVWSVHYFCYRKKVAKKEAALIAIANKANTASAAKSDYLATMSHEIRTPMHAVIGVQGLLLKRVDLTPEQKDLVESANTSSQSLMGIMNNVLDMSKIEAGKYILELQPTNLKQLLHEINQTFTIFSENKRVSLVANIDPLIADVLLIDPLRLRQILQNLLSNAIKFSVEGVVFFDVRIMANDHAGQLIEFRIIDNGVGMAKEDIERALKPYEQVGSHTTSNQTSTPGTGLGLSICNHAINLMQSQLNIESIPNLGTNVHFITAFSRTGLEIPQVIKPPAGNHQQLWEKTRALIVEDHPANRKVLFIQLQTLGINADQVSSGSEALERMKYYSYDLILTDHSMPGMHGFELVKKIRESGKHKLIIIGVTADIYAHQSRDFLLKSGMDAVLIKPISLEVLEHQIFTLLGADAITSNGNNFCLDKDTRILVLEEVLKVQNETLLTIALDADSGLLNASTLNSLLHKVKGGALLSQADDLHQCCTDLERSNQAIAERISLFKQALLDNNLSLENQIHHLKKL